MDEEEAVRLPGRFLVDGLQFLLGQQGRELLENCFQLELVAEAPDAHELHVHPDGGADEPQLLARDPGGDLHVASADEERVQGPVPGAAVQLRLICEVVDHDQNLVKLLEAQLLRGPGDLLLLLDDGAKGSLVPLVEVDLLPVRVDAHVVLDEVLHGLPGIVNVNARRHDYHSFKNGFTAGRAVLVQDGADESHRLPRFRGPEEDPRARHAGDDRVAWLFRGVFGGGEELHFSHLGSPRSPGTAGAAGSTTRPGSGQASAGCPASERFRGAGRLGRLRSGCAWNRPVGWEAKAGCSKCGWSSGSESRTCSRTRRRRAAPACRADSSAARFAGSRRPTTEAGGTR